MLNNLLGDNYPIIKWDIENNKNIMYIKSKVKSCKCPNCHIESVEYHSTYIRKIQDTPIHNMETWLYVTAYEFTCTNKSCDVKTFNEVLPFARKNKVMSDMLVQFILSISIFLSSSSAALILSFIGAKVSADTIDNIIKKIKIVDNPDVEKVGIDDVAIRKGQTYATAIYDLEDHHLIALLEGRDAENLKEWLLSHKKIKVIARDRASAYASAISEILPACMQVADRFHLFENLIKYLKELFYKEVPEKIFIQNNEIVNSVKKISSELTNIDKNILNSFNYNNSEPIDEFGNRIKFDNKNHDLDSKQYIEQAQRRLEKQNLITSIREKLKTATCHQTKDIADQFGISTYLVRKYKRMTDEEVKNIVNRKDYKKGKTLMDDYINIIYKMLKEDIDSEYIMAYVKKKGFQGSDIYLRNYINLIAKNNGMNYEKQTRFIKFEYPKDVTIITRYELLKYVLTLDSKKKKNQNITNHLETIIKKYSIVKEIEEIFKNFHDTIFSEEPDRLDYFIEKYDDTLSSFCSGLKKDIAPVKNAISNKINSGFVEGNNNKFKLIKRIVYGKQKLCNLFKKSYLCFMSTLDTFDIEDIVSGVLDEN